MGESKTRDQILSENDLKEGDKVRVDDELEGKIQPSTQDNAEDVLVLKLDSGYNVGVKPEEIELIEKAEARDTQEREIERSPENPDILILHTGGTIASRVSYEEGGVTAAFEPEDLVEMYPELAEEVNLHSEIVGQIMSEDMEPGHWKKIAEAVHEKKDDYDGIIIGHGTDTLADTSAALSMMLKGIDTGVMIVGAQRSSDRPSTDARMNLYCGAKFLTETEFQGVGVCMHRNSSDKVCNILHGAKARKMHTSRRDAFKPINTEPLGSVNYETGEIEFETRESPDYDPEIELNENVGFIKVRPGMDPEKMDFLINQDYDGVVIEGTGLGHMPISDFDQETEHHAKIREKLEELTEDTLVVIASNCIHGRINLNVYENQKKLKQRGVIGSRDMHPELAYVKLAWSLGQAEDIEEAQEIFLENRNGEITGRTTFND